jgi:hypothetical protein
MRDTAYRSLLVFLTVLTASSLNKLQKFYYSTQLSYLHCRYPLHACALECEITTTRYCQLSYGSWPQKYYIESLPLLCLGFLLIQVVSTWPYCTSIWLLHARTTDTSTPYDPVYRATMYTAKPYTSKYYVDGMLHIHFLKEIPAASSCPHFWRHQ